MTYLKECDIMSERPIGLGKVAENGTLNENGTFYSVQDINVLLEEKGGGGGDLPTPTVADAGSVVVVDNEGKYVLGEAGGGGDGLLVTITRTDGGATLNKNYSEIKTALNDGKSVVFMETSIDGGVTTLYSSEIVLLSERANNYVVVLYGIDTDNSNAIFTEGYVSETNTGVLTYIEG